MGRSGSNHTFMVLVMGVWLSYLTALSSALTVAVVTGLWAMGRAMARRMQQAEITLAVMGERQEQAERALAYRADQLIAQNRRIMDSLSHLDAVVDTHLGWHEGRRKEAS